MDERAVAAKVKELNKVLAANEPASVIVTVIETFRKEAAPAEEVIRATRAGVVIGKLRSHSSKEVSRIAAEIVSKWKKSVEAAKHGKHKKISSPSTPRGTASPAPPASTHSQPYTGDPLNRLKYSDEGVDVNRTSSKVRNASIGLIYNGIAYRSTQPADAILEKALQVEAAAWEAFNKTESAGYKQKMRSLFQNLKSKTNIELGRKVMSGEITPAKFVVMTHEELKSAEQKKQEEALEKENMKKAQVPMAEKSISTALTCGKCGQKKVSYSQAQTRSADEPMTTFCECTICGNRWKFS
ncbi:Transcription elongation factor S-II [Pleurostoma richardsiae]|uniref:Transcription elongation factor n=1 Tax=Pleurostoma richardsiae TaxID=41990 RepID=A0AA38VHC3_9PEZI|nr:Transcription elongation factor S-II [Pleurostoma richardsiae]